MQVVRRADHEVVGPVGLPAEEVLELHAVGEELRVREVIVEDAYRVGDVVARD